jgi:hypothetical protein
VHEVRRLTADQMIHRTADAGEQRGHSQDKGSNPEQVTKEAFTLDSFRTHFPLVKVRAARREVLQAANLRARGNPTRIATTEDASC